MGINGKPLGVVIGVDGTVSQIGMYNSSNTDEFICLNKTATHSRLTSVFLTLIFKSNKDTFHE